MIERSTATATTATRLGAAGWTIAAIALATVFAAFASGVVRNELDASHRIPDGAGYRFQAEVFALGRIAAPAPPMPESFRPSLTVVRDGKWFAQYYPGFSLVLAAFVRLGVDWLVNPVGGALLVLGTFLLGRRLFSNAAGLVGALLVASSPLTLALATTYLSHTWCAALLVFAGVLALGGRDTGTLPRIVAAGFLFGWAVATRPYTALLLGWPFALIVLLRGLPFALAFAGGALPWVVALPAWNHYLVGDPWSSPYDLLFPHHRLGFHEIPARRGILPDRVIDRYDLEVARLVTLRQIESARDTILPLAHGAAAVILPIALLKQMRRAGIVLLLLPLCLLGGYFLYPGSMGRSATMFGPRYYSEAMPALLLAIAHAAVVLAARGRMLGRATLILAAVALGIFGHRHARDFARSVDRRHSSLAISPNREPERFLASLDETPRLLFVDVSTMHRDSVLLANRPDLSRPNLFAVYEQPATNRAVLDAFPGREAWLVRWSPHGEPERRPYVPEEDATGPPRVFPYTRAGRPGVFEAEALD